MNKIYVLILVLCFTNFSFSQNKKPDWIHKYPILENDYIGIASSLKSNSNYKEIAKQNALNILSNSISVNVSVVSVFAQNETNKKFSEEFNEVTKTQTKNYIEGFEIQAEWEDKKNYWIFIKINKQKFQENKERKKNEVSLQAFDLYKNGIKHDEANQIQLALLNYTRALSLLSPFLSESIVINDNGKSIFLANEIVNQISKMYKEINFRIPNTTLKTFRAKELNNVELFAYRASSNLAYIPIKFLSNDVSILGNNHQTDKNGKYVFSTSPFIQNDKSNYLISVSVNFESLLKEATQDNLIINLFAELNPNILNIRIENSNSIFDNNNGSLIQTTFPTSTTFSQNTSFEQKNETNDKLKYTNFETMCSGIKNKLPKEQLEIIAHNAPNMTINAKQLAKLLAVISFDDDKIKVVSLYLPYLNSNTKNLYKILAKEITFDRYKNELKRIIELSQ